MESDLARARPGAARGGSGAEGADGEPGGGRGTSTITFLAGDLHHDMRHRLSDVGVCHLLEDARDGGGDLVLVGKNIFRKDEERPLIDEIIVPNTGLVEGLVGRG